MKDHLMTIKSVLRSLLFNWRAFRQRVENTLVRNISTLQNYPNLLQKDQRARRNCGEGGGVVVEGGGENCILTPSPNR